MSIALDLLQGAAFLLALCFIQSFVVRLWPQEHVLSKVLSGVLFGGVCIAGMMLPIELAPGVIVDARPVIISMAAAVTGPLVGVITTVVAAIFRLYLGGAGAVVGVWTMVLSLLMGLAYYHAHRRGWVSFGWWQFLLFGAVANFINLVSFLSLLPVIPPEEYLSYGSLHVGIYAVATALLGCMLQDVMKRSEMERTLQESELRYRTAYDSLPVGVIETDGQGVIQSMNRAAERIYACPAEKAIGMQMGAFVPEEVRAQFESDADFIEKVVSPSLRQSVEAQGLRADGTIIPIQVNNGVMLVNGRTTYITLVTDLTDLKAMEDKLIRAQKMEAVGQLTGGIAHDFNNILGIIEGNLELLQDIVSDKPDATKRVDAALRGTRRGSDITRKLLNFARQAPAGFQVISVNDVLTGMYELTSRSLTVSVELDMQLASDVWPVVTNAGDLQDAILNLALNARDAMPDGGTITISTSNLHSVSATEDGVEPGDWVKVSVSDTGTGMSDEVIEQAFEPFFSTKEEGRGSGLGLSMVYGFVSRSGGHVDIESRPGSGTTVRICLPRAHGASAPAKKVVEKEVRGLPSGKEHVLIVDDEEALVELAKTTLESLGYRTHCVGDAGAAMEVLRSDAPVDLLFSDVVLPGEMDGFRLASEARRLRPGLPVLLTSGYARRLMEQRGDLGPEGEALARFLLKKPYRRSEMAHAVRRVLDARMSVTTGE